MGYFREVSAMDDLTPNGDPDEGEEHLVNYRALYMKLKIHSKQLIRENECLRRKLHECQRELLQIEKDRSFLLSLLHEHEKRKIQAALKQETRNGK